MELDWRGPSVDEAPELDTVAIEVVEWPAERFAAVEPSSLEPAQVSAQIPDGSISASAAATVYPPPKTDIERSAAVLPDGSDGSEGQSRLAMRGAITTRGPDFRVRDSERGDGSRSSGAILDPRRAAEAVIGDPGPPPPSPQRNPLTIVPPRLTGGLNQVDDGPRSELKPAGNGTFKAEDLVFTAKVGRDGRVKIDDKRNLNVGLKLPSPRGMARAVEKWSEKSYEEKRVGGTASSDGIVPIVGGSFDLTDWAMRASGQDPYYHRKKQFFDRTRAERTKMARIARSQDIDRELSTLSVRLGKLWANQAMPVAERRVLLFQLWDECAETGASEVIEAGNQARKKILAFIRIKIPAGSPDAFSNDEIAKLNRKRQSKQRFRPYP